MPCPSSFQNDMTTFRNKDDVLTLLIHLGYLAYNQKRQTAFIPNEEIRSEFASAENNIEKIHTEYVTDYPVLMAELKWNKDAGTALQQIKNKQYPESIAQYTGKILLVEISYDQKSKAHQCVIEKYTKGAVAEYVL